MKHTKFIKIMLLTACLSTELVYPILYNRRQNNEDSNGNEYNGQTEQSYPSAYGYPGTYGYPYYNTAIIQSVQDNDSSSSQKEKSSHHKGKSSSKGRNDKKNISPSSKPMPTSKSMPAHGSFLSNMSPAQKAAFQDKKTQFLAQLTPEQQAKLQEQKDIFQAKMQGQSSSQNNVTTQSFDNESFLANMSPSQQAALKAKKDEFQAKLHERQTHNHNGAGFGRNSSSTNQGDVTIQSIDSDNQDDTDSENQGMFRSRFAHMSPSQKETLQSRKAQFIAQLTPEQQANLHAKRTKFQARKAEWLASKEGSPRLYQESDNLDQMFENSSQNADRQNERSSLSDLVYTQSYENDGPDYFYENDVLIQSVDEEDSHDQALHNMPALHEDQAAHHFQEAVDAAEHVPVVDTIEYHANIVELPVQESAVQAPVQAAPVIAPMVNTQPIAEPQPVIQTIKFVKVYPVFDAVKAGAEQVKIAAMDMWNYLYSFIKKA